MSVWILDEAGLLLQSAAAGAGLAFLYGLLRFFRRIFRHGPVLLGMEDLGFWCFAAFAVFALLYRENDGVLRLYVIGTVLFAMGVVSRILDRILRKVLKKRGG